ncbi:hypothetical protein ABIE09_003412 [Lysobacter enzymogenes]|uniref:XAC0095 family protein n=1 Tax=Lysobacter enzymogenes TaxID=69 RepID=UPI00339B2FDB
MREHTVVSCCQGCLLSKSARQALFQVRGQLRLLAQLTEPQGESVGDIVYLSADALAECFDRLARDIDHVVEMIGPPLP